MLEAIKRRVLHPATAVTLACIAVFLSLAANAWAPTSSLVGGSNSVDSSTVKNNSLSSKDIRNGSLLPADLKLGTGTIAFAHVLVDGTLDPAGSRNVTVLSAAGGKFCLDVKTAPVNAVATIDVGGADSRKDLVALTLTPAAIAPVCPEGTDVLVFTADGNIVNSEARPFYIQFN